MAEPNLLHDPSDRPLAGNTDAFHLFYEKRLIFPRTVSVCQIFIKSLPFADFRRLATKKAPAYSKNSFSSFRRRISFSCSLTCLHRTDNSSARLIAVHGVCETGLVSDRPAITAFVHAYMVLSGMPSSEAAFAPPSSDSPLWAVLRTGAWKTSCPPAWTSLPASRRR